MACEVTKVIDFKALINHFGEQAALELGLTMDGRALEAVNNRGAPNRIRGGA